jgi:HSP20 family protein
MNVRSLVPSIRRRGSIPVRPGGDYPFFSLQKEVSSFFDDLWDTFSMVPYGSLDVSIDGNIYPSIDVKETDKNMIITAELPGIDEKDIEVLLEDGALTIKGEKKEEREEKGENYYHCERVFGAFDRSIPLHEGLDTTKVDARFKNGVLTIDIPKTVESQSAKGRKVSIHAD